MSDPHDVAVPLHTSLTTPILLAGTPRAFAILNVTLCAAIGLGLRQLWLALPVGLLAHGIAVWLTKTGCLVARRVEAASPRKAFLRGLTP